MRQGRAWIAGFAVAGLATAAAAAPPAWRGHGNDPQHTAAAPAKTQSAAAIKWHAKVDASDFGVGQELAIHYAGPVITAANTVIFPYRITPPSTWQIVARDGATGASLWTETTDYISPPTTQLAWTPVVPIHLSAQNKLFYAGAGGTVFRRNLPDSASGKAVRLVFYGASVYAANEAALAQDVTVSTPITADGFGNIYFGFSASSANPAKLVSGIARIAANGTGTWVSATAAAADATITEVQWNCAPAVSANGKIIYIAVSNGASGYLLGLDATTLATTYKVALTDPASGAASWVTDLSTSSPTIGPDGDVYFGVLETPYPSHNDRGWLLHFDATLSKVKTPGSFGWDDTVSVVPAKLIPGYKASGSYLLMTKYNNYIDIGTGDGKNRIAILDPNATEADPIIPAVSVMNEVQTQLGPTAFPGGAPGQVYEWCINSSAVDAKGGAVFAGSEDGHMYRWDLASNTINQSLTLNAPRPEPYTPSEVGPDGTIYSLNNATLYAIGAAAAAARH